MKVSARFKAVVFDLDDTLYPERAFVHSGFRAVARELHGRAGLNEDATWRELVELHDSGVRRDTFRRWLNLRLPEQSGWEQDLVTVYREHLPQIRPFAEVLPVLESLRPSFRLGLVSDGFLDVQRRKWAALGLEPWFEAVQFSDELGRECWKPSPEPFRRVLDRLGVEPEQAMYVGDNPLKDFLGARELGLATCWIRRPGGEYSHLEPPSPSHAADEVCADLREFLGVWECSHGI